MTRLRSLDLSNNKLENLLPDEIFRLPKNLSEIYLSNNYISSLPWKYLQNVTKIDLLDIRNNLFENFSPELMKIVTARSQVLFEGNGIIYVK